MEYLYLVKSFPVREYCISRSLLNKQQCQFDIICATFSQRNFIDVTELQAKKQVFSKIYNFVEFAKVKLETNIRDISNKLNKYEEEYNIPVNFALHADRYIVNHTELRRRQKLCLLIEFAVNIFQKQKINAVFGELSSASDIIFYYLAKKFNIPYIFFWHGRIKNRIEFSSLEGKRLGLAAIYNSKKKKGLTLEEEQIVNHYIASFFDKESNLISPDYMKFADTTQLKQLFKKTYHEGSIKRFFKYCRSYYYDSKWSADMDPSISLKLKHRLNKITFVFRKAILNKYFQSSCIEDRYYLFPLHYQPEASTMTFAQDYLNQLAFIENIVKHLPAGAYLYVKEHPAMMAYREIAFYRQLVKLPNVKLISPNETIRDLILNSQGIITLTSTTGYEAIIYDKPVFVFGNVFYNEYDYVIKCKSFNNLLYCFNDVSNKWKFDFDLRQINKKYFIYACLSSLKPGNLNYHVYDYTVLNEDNLSKIAAAVNITL